MKPLTALITLFFCLIFVLPSGELSAQERDGVDGQLRIIAFGAHPDDCEISSAGVAAMWAAEGHAFKCVSMTNGDIGHFGMSGGELALRRMDEVKAAAEILGIETEVMDIHDGELVPSLANRKKVARIIRDWQADIVMAHRRYGYHADHRYSGVLVDDAIILVEARFFTPDTPPLPRSPVYLNYYDPFERPIPFEPAIVVGIDEVLDQKRSALEQMPSQFSDTDSWTYGRSDDVPEEESERLRQRIDQLMERNENVANLYRDMLIDIYGEQAGNDIQHAEAFELSELGRQVSAEELKELFLTDEQ